MSRENYITTRGAWDVRHWIHIPSISHEADLVQISHHLKSVSGVRKVEVNRSSRKIRVTYDQTRTDYDHILKKLEEIGFPVSESWWSKKKGAWFQYLDTNARDSANAPSPPCCSNPKGVNTGRKAVVTKRHK